VERFAKYDARFNRMEERMEALERENTVLREAVLCVVWFLMGETVVRVGSTWSWYFG
jgi:hypothetical protein